MPQVQRPTLFAQRGFAPSLPRDYQPYDGPDMGYVFLWLLVIAILLLSAGAIAYVSTVLINPGAVRQVTRWGSEVR
jgi:hypothetical protein